MKIQKTFGDCLGLFLKTLNISSSRLAKGINVDASLVNRWLHGKRIPSYHTDYVESISEYLSHCIINSYQEKNLDETIMSICGTTDCWLTGTGFKHKIKTVLHESQGYSIEEFKVKPSVNTYFERFDEGISNVAYKNESPVCNNFTVVGRESALEHAVKFLETASESSNGNDSVIYICLNNMKSQLSDFNFNKYLVKSKNFLLKALDNDYRIQFLIKPNKNNRIAQAIINFWQPFIDSGKVALNYYKNYNYLDYGNEILVVPRVGVILGLMNKDCGTGCYIVSYCSDISAFENHMSSVAAELTKPLLTLYREKNSFQYYKHLLSNKIGTGNRYLLTDMSSILLLPESILKKLLEQGRDGRKIYYIYKDYLKYIEVFKTNLSYYKYTDIYYIDTFFSLIMEKRIILHGPSGVTVLNVNTQDVINLLDNFVHMLENYDNYNISLINKHFLPDSFPYTYLFLKEGQSAIIGLKNQKDKAPYYLSIDEPSVVDLYVQDFLRLQENIPPFYKSKADVIKLFKSHVEEIKRRESKLNIFKKNKKPCPEAFTSSEHDFINNI